MTRVVPTTERPVRVVTPETRSVRVTLTQANADALSGTDLPDSLWHPDIESSLLLESGTESLLLEDGETLLIETVE